MRILVVEDEKRIADFLSRGLESAGYAVDVAGDGAHAIDMVHATEYDLIVLDLGLPDMDGLAVLQKIRNRKTSPPVLILSARDHVDDRVKGLEGGADDYLVKPFEPRELVLRIRAMLRRAPPPQPEQAAGPVQLGALVFDRERGELRDGDGPLRLTGGEAALLSALAAKPNEVLSREEIAAALSMDDAGERAIDVQVTRLRRKVEADPREPRFVHTVRGRGYVLKPGV